jgi:hypothetical protein
MLETQWQWYHALYGQKIAYPIVAADDPVPKRPAVDREGRKVVVDGRQVYMGMQRMPGWDAPENKRSRLHISRTWNDDGYLGWGSVGWVTQKDPLYIFSIALNSDYMNNDYVDKYGDPGITDPAVWSGVIVHECLHNLGYDHPIKGDRNYDQVADYLIFKFQELHGPLPDSAGKAERIRGRPWGCRVYR